MQILKIALAKGRLSKQSIKLFKSIGYTFPQYSEKSRKLVFQDSTNRIEIILVKSPDVSIYVEKGAADIGIVGKDVLMENPANVYEFLNLNIGVCNICTAGFPDKHVDYTKKVIVGTKYPNIAKEYFNKRGIMTEMIKLNGSVELAPIIGLSDIIVDIVESGKTLKENGLEVLEKINEISARLVVNKVSLKTKKNQIVNIVDKIKEII